METSVLPDEELAAPKSEIDFNNHSMPYTADNSVLVTCSVDGTTRGAWLPDGSD